MFHGTNYALDFWSGTTHLVACSVRMNSSMNHHCKQNEHDHYEEAKTSKSSTMYSARLSITGPWSGTSSANLELILTLQKREGAHHIVC